MTDLAEDLLAAMDRDHADRFKTAIPALEAAVALAVEQMSTGESAAVRHGLIDRRGNPTAIGQKLLAMVRVPNPARDDFPEAGL